MTIKQTFCLDKGSELPCLNYYVNESRVGICPRCGSQNIVSSGYWREIIGLLPVIEVRPMYCNNCGLGYISKAVPDEIIIEQKEM